MDCPDTASTTSSSKSSSSKTSSNEAGCCNMNMKSKPSSSRKDNNIGTDLANAIMHRLQQEQQGNDADAEESPRFNDSSDSGEDSAKRAATGTSSSSGRGRAKSGTTGSRSSADNSDSNVPIWSPEPAVNALAILLILQDLEKSRQQEEENGNPQQATTHALVQTLLTRLSDVEGLQPEDLANTDFSSLLDQLRKTTNTQSGVVTVTTDSQSSEARSGSEDDEKQAKKNPAEEREVNSGGETTSPADSSDGSKDGSRGSASPTADAPGSESPTETATAEEGSAASPKAASLKDDDTGTSSDPSKKTKPTKQELLAALQQHMAILHKRGQVSSVIPTFLRPTAGMKRAGDDDDATEGLPAASVSSTLAVRKAKRRRKTPTRDGYYEELAAELLAHSAVPIPDCVEIPMVVEPELDLQPLTESEESDLSLCSSSGTPNSSDFESSTGETTTTGTDSSVRGRSVSFATKPSGYAAAVDSNIIGKKEARVVSTSSRSSGEPLQSGSSSSGSSGEQ